jgi:hypothetical protein
MRQPATAVDEIRLLGLYCGLVRMREHRRYLSVQFAADRWRVARVLVMLVAALSDLGIHPDVRIRMDNLWLGESVSVSVAELQNRIGSRQLAFSEHEKEQDDSPPPAHPFLVELQGRFGSAGQGPRRGITPT